MNEIIVIKQLPIIEEQLRLIKTEIEEKVNVAVNLVCSEDTVKEVKAVRSKLNKDFRSLEEQRITVKNKILEPYERFEAVYRDCVTDIFKPADKQLKDKIAVIEDALKQEKRQELEEYFSEYAASKSIDFLRFGDMDVNISLSSSKKSLRDQIKAFVDRVENDLQLITAHEHMDEILVEYKRSLNCSLAVITVKSRRQALEQEMKKKAIALQGAGEIEDKPKSYIKPNDTMVKTESTVLSPPKVEKSDEILELTFKVVATVEKLRALKKFLDSGGYIYE